MPFSGERPPSSGPIGVNWWGQTRQQSSGSSGIDEIVEEKLEPAVGLEPTTC